MPKRRETRQTGIRFPAWMLDWIDQHAEALGRTRTEIILRAVEKFIAENGGPTCDPDADR